MGSVCKLDPPALHGEPLFYSLFLGPSDLTSSLQLCPSKYTWQFVITHYHKYKITFYCEKNRSKWKLLDISHIIPYDLLFETMEFMSKISDKSACPFFLLASLPIVSKDYSAKRPLPFMLKLAACPFFSPPRSHKLFNLCFKHNTVLPKFSPSYSPLIPTFWDYLPLFVLSYSQWFTHSQSFHSSFTFFFPAAFP